MYKGILAVIALLLIGCANTKTLVTEATYMDAEITSGKVLQVINSIAYQEEEAAVITDAFMQYSTFRTKHTALFSDLKNLSLGNVAEVLKDFEALRHSYDRLNAVVSVNFLRYSEVSQLQLSSYMVHVMKLDKAYKEAVQADQRQGMLKNIAAITLTVGQILSNIK